MRVSPGGLPPRSGAARMRTWLRYSGQTGMTTTLRKALLRLHCRAFWLVVLVLCLLASCKTSAWKEFRCDEGGFTITLPGRPAVATQQQETTAGPLAVKTYTLRLGAGDAAYIVAFNDYPEAVLRASTPDEILDRVVKGALGDHGKLRRQLPVEFEKHKGRDVLGSVHGGLEYRSRFYLVGKRLYQISVVSKAAAVRAEDVSKFLESFRLLPRQA
jgi:hypothetical protein